MKKLLRLVLIVALPAVAFSCGGGKADKGEQTTDSVTAVVTPYDFKQAGVGEEQSVYGVAIDRAMNSIMLLTIEGDTMSFEYPDVEENFKFVRCNIGDSVTVKYVRTEYQDSVTAVLRGKVL